MLRNQLRLVFLGEDCFRISAIIFARHFSSGLSREPKTWTLTGFTFSRNDIGQPRGIERVSLGNTTSPSARLCVYIGKVNFIQLLVEMLRKMPAAIVRSPFGGDGRAGGRGPRRRSPWSRACRARA